MKNQTPPPICGPFKFQLRSQRIEDILKKWGAGGKNFEMKNLNTTDLP